ncbi:MAG TPA: tripartite tricarboxylate transporter substrate binding protein [Thermodesulfobacteriota bacterium]|nr:tripartite tricarboxylate transporter substrate binding protein [Thermodesulfobacteriota bacterium]
MKTTIRIFTLILVISALMAWAPMIWAQPYPNRPIQLIIPIPAGGGGDVNGRLLVEDLVKILGQQIMVVNKPGASDSLGTDALAKSKKDGYTLGYTSSAAMVFARVTNPESVPYDPIKDFDPLGSHTFFPLCFAVQANSPWKTFNDLIDYAKKNPGKLRVSTAGVGSTANFDVELTQTLTGAEFTHVPFKGGEAVVTALLGGHVEVSCDIVGKFLPHVEAGKVRFLLVSRKISFLPNVPTITELGYKRELLSGWHGMFGPSGLPEDVKKILIPAVEKAVKNPETKAKIEKVGYTVEYKSPEEQKRLITNDYETAKAIAVKLGLSK